MHAPRSLAVPNDLSTCSHLPIPSMHRAFSSPIRPIAYSQRAFLACIHPTGGKLYRECFRSVWEPASNCLVSFSSSCWPRNTRDILYKDEWTQHDDDDDDGATLTSHSCPRTSHRSPGPFLAKSAPFPHLHPPSHQLYALYSSRGDDPALLLSVSLLLALMFAED
jgi:hypothetical protein